MALTLRPSHSARDQSHAARATGQYLEAAGQQRGHVPGGEVPTYAGGGGVRGLVDVYLGRGWRFWGVVVELARAAAADRCGRRKREERGEGKGWVSGGEGEERGRGHAGEDLLGSKSTTRDAPVGSFTSAILSTWYSRSIGALSSTVVCAAT